MVRWTENLSVGVVEIDNQHKELFERVDQLVQAMSEGKGKAEIDATISFLEKYVVTHFTAEERLMARSSYPDYEEHAAQHQAFVEAFDALKGSIGAASGSLTVIQLHRSVVDWLITHIGRSDKALGAFITDGKRRAA